MTCENAEGPLGNCLSQDCSSQCSSSSSGDGG
jgi:hypothetical protein